MSAIFGVLRFDDASVDRRDVARMGATLRHRSPDGLYQEVLGPVGLGFGRMRVVHADTFDVQPLHDQAGLSIVASARIDNREILATALAIDAATLAAMSDAGLILAAYRRWGEACTDHLLGDFAFAIWDAMNGRLLLARDHMGQRHLMYHLGDGFIAFAREIKALWAYPEVPRAINPVAAARHLMIPRDYHSDGGLFSGIGGLRPGERMVIGRDGATATTRYWQPHADPAHLGHDDADYIAAYRSVLSEAVECRVRHLIDRPALHLSGGFDSSAIAGLTGPVLRGQGRTMVAIASVMAEDRPGYAKDARPMVAAVARDMPHLEVRYVTREELDPFADLDASLAVSDGPPSFLSYVYLDAARIARAGGARLLMDGHGGDYTLNPRGGTALFRFARTGQWLRYIAELRAVRRRFGWPLLATIKQQIRQGGPTWLLKLLALTERSERHWRWQDSLVEPNYAQGLLDAQAIPAAHVVGPSPGAWPRDRTRETLDRVASQIGPAPLDMIAFGQGLMVTRPFHDRRVIELALAIPEDLQFGDGLNRHLARRALADVYPAEFQTRDFHNDDRVPDWAEVLAASADDLSRRVETLATDKQVAQVIALDDLPARLAAPAPWDLRKAKAQKALILGMYMKWFNGGNR